MADSVFEGYRDRAEELVRDMSEDGIGRADIQSILMNAVVSEAPVEEEEEE